MNKAILYKLVRLPAFSTCPTGMIWPHACPSLLLPFFCSPSDLKESTMILVSMVFELKPHPRLAKHVPANEQQLVLHKIVVGRERQAFLSPPDSPMSDTSSGPRASRGASLAMQGGRDGCELLMLAKDAQVGKYWYHWRRLVRK